MVEYIVAGITALISSFLVALFVAIVTMFADKNRGVHKKTIVQFLFVWYMMFLAMSVFAGFNRNTQQTHLYNIKFMQSYIELFRHFSWSRFAQIFLNFVLFMPFGLLYDVVFENTRYQKFIFLCAAIVIVTIEFTQYSFRLGIADIDDFFTNLLGVCFGNAVYKIYYICKRQAHVNARLQVPVSTVLAICVPILLVVAYFMYNSGEYGNLGDEFERSSVVMTCTTEIDLSEYKLPKEAYLYSLVEENVHTEKISTIFEALGYNLVDVDAYETCYVCHSAKREYELWYFFESGTFYLDNFNDDSELFEEKSGVEKGLIALLEAMDMFVPTGSVFKETEKNVYCMDINFIEADGVIYDGSITCKMDGKHLSSMRYEVYPLKYLATVEIPSMTKIVEKIEKGEFYFVSTEFIPDSNDRFIIGDIKLRHVLDTKNVYRPLLEISGISDDTSAKIYLSTINER